MAGTDLQQVPAGVQPPAPAGTFLPTVLVAIMGPYPMLFGDRTTLDSTLDACAVVGATPVFIPDLITDAEKANEKKGSRLRGHTAMRNEGIRMAEEGGYDYLLLIENDVKLSPNTLFRLLKHDQGIMLPRLTYPAFDPVEWMCYGPRDKALRGGLLELIWAAHCCILFKVDTLRSIPHPVFQGFWEEGKDHDYWRNQGLHPQMDLDTPVEVLQLAKGHHDLYQIPFCTHISNGRSCEGPVYLYRQGRHVRIYHCKAEGCKYEMTALMPEATEKTESNSYDVMAQLSLERDYWAGRAPLYCNLAWVQDEGYLAKVVTAGRVSPDDLVLDAGTGAGVIASRVAETAKDVIGMDLSPQMLALVDGRHRPNLEFVNGDIRAIPYPRFFFSKVFARMVLHGLVEDGDMEKAIRECRRVLREGGRLVVSEGVPTSRTIREWYTETFKHKEQRLIFSVSRLRGLLERTGFRDIEATTHTIRQSSVRNWLDNSALSPEKIEHIMGRYQEMPEYVSKGYHATFTAHPSPEGLGDNDVLIDLKFAIVTGTK